MVYLVNIMLGLLFAFLGLLIGKFKMYGLIAGVNTASEEQKGNMDLPAMGKAIALMCYGVALANLVPAALNYFFGFPLYVAPILTVAIIIVSLVRIQRYDHNVKSRESTMKAVRALVIVAIVGGILISQVIGEHKVIITDASVKVSGMFGKTFAMEDVVSVREVQEMPRVTLRANGLGIGSIQRGQFRLEGAKKAYLYLSKREGPYIEILTEDYPVYINFRDQEAYRSTLEALLALEASQQ
jgi:hypothetical protein